MANAVDVLFGKKRAYVQEPRYLYYPELPQIQFYERSAFPWLDAVEAAASDIREELKGVIGGDFRPYVTQARGREDVDIDDWTIPDALAETLDLQDVFARYPADLDPPPSTRSPDFALAPAGADRERILRAVVRGPFYAGRVAVARWPCGEACENWALVDLASGRVAWMDDMLRLDFPCKKAEALEFSEASRLLRVHRLDGERVLTRDFVWSYEGLRLVPAGESARSVEEFCLAAARR